MTSRKDYYQGDSGDPLIMAVHDDINEIRVDAHVHTGSIQVIIEIRIWDEWQRLCHDPAQPDRPSECQEPLPEGWRTDWRLGVGDTMRVDHVDHLQGDYDARLSVYALEDNTTAHIVHRAWNL
jgi:hypothetical protein